MADKRTGADRGRGSTWTTDAVLQVASLRQATTLYSAPRGWQSKAGPVAMADKRTGADRGRGSTWTTDAVLLSNEGVTGRRRIGSNNAALGRPWLVPALHGSIQRCGSPMQVWVCFRL